MSKMMRQHRLAREQRKASGTQDFQTDRDLNIEQPSTDDVRVAARKRANAFKGKFVALVQSPKNKLELVPNPAGIGEFIDDNHDHLGDDILAVIDPTGAKYSSGFERHDVWGDKQVFRELIADALKSGWVWLEPSDIGGPAIQGPILESPDGRIYFHENYKLQSAADELLKGQTILLDGVPENRAPKIEVPVKAASAKKADVDGVPAEPAHGMHAPSTSGNPYQEWKTENLIETIESLTDSESFAKDKPEQKAVEQMAEVLSARPVEPEVDETKKAATLKKATLKTKTANEAARAVESAIKQIHEFQLGGWVNTQLITQAISTLKAIPEGAIPENSRRGYDRALYELEAYDEGNDGEIERAATELYDIEIAFSDRKQASKRATIEHRPGHHNSDGEPAEWVNVNQHGKIVSSSPTKEAAEERLRTMEYYKNAAAIGGFPPSDENTGKILEGDKSIPVGREFQDDNTGITLPKVDTVHKFAGIDTPSENSETGKVIEGDKSIEATPAEEDHTGVTVPATELPEQVAKEAAGPITTSKALSLIEDLAEKLQKLYLDAKPITTANETRPVREAVESIFHASKLLGEAQKVLAKQKKQEEDEAAAQAVNEKKNKKSSSLLANLKVAAAEEEEDETEE